MRKFFCEIFGGTYTEKDWSVYTIGKLGELSIKLNRIKTNYIPLKILALRIWWLKTKIKFKNKL